MHDRPQFRHDPSLEEIIRRVNKVPPSSSLGRPVRAPYSNPYMSAKQKTKQPSHGKIIDPEGEQEKPLIYYVEGIVHVFWKRLMCKSIVARVIIFFLISYAISTILNSLIQMLAPSTNYLYIMLGTLVSALIIYQFSDKKGKTQ
jgi:hypothetical protein